MDLWTISTFARATGLPPTALRHYDETGLLPPAEVDAGTGYRYYTPDQVHRAELVAAMREAGLAIGEMRAVLDGDAPAALAVVLARARERAGRIGALAAGLRGPGAPVEVEIAGPALAAAIRQVLPAAERAADSALAAVLLDLADGALDVVATNRYWLATASLPVAGSGAARAVLAPGEALALADALDRAPTATLALDGRPAEPARHPGEPEPTTGPGVTLDGRHHPGLATPYPDHRAVARAVDPATTRALLRREDLLAPGSSEVELVLGPECTLAGRSVAGFATGAPVTALLGRALLTRAAGTLLGRDVQVALGSPQRALTLTGPSQPGFTVLLMPIAR